MSDFTTVHGPRASDVGIDSLQRDDVGLSTHVYKKLFGDLQKNGDRRSAARGVLKIQLANGGGLAIYRKYRGLGKLKENEVLLDNLSIAELQPKGKNFIGPVALHIEAAGWFGRKLMYWHHPDDAPRVAFRIGMVSIVITTVGVLLSVILWLFPLSKEL